MFEPLMSPLALIVALGVAGIIVWHLQGRGRPYARLVVQIAFFMAMTALLLANGISPHRFQPFEGGGVMLIAAKLLWWTHLAWAAIGFVRIYIVLDGRPREARLLQDLIVAIVYLGVVLSVLAFVFGLAIGTLLATSGVIAIIFGLALQSTLNDVFSGLALTLGRPYGIGDWIVLADGIEGRVAESTWRSTHILTPANNVVILPNSLLAKIGLTNISRPDETHQLALPLRVRASKTPSVIVEALRDAMAGSNFIVHEPAPIVALKSVDALAIDLDLQFRVRRPADRIPARNELMDLVCRQCAATGIAFAVPAAATVLMHAVDTAVASAETTSDLLSSSPILANLEPDARATLATSARPRQFHPGEAIPDQADIPWLMIVRSGAVRVLHQDTEITRLGPEAIIGGIDEAYGLKYEALTRLDALEIEGVTLDTLLREAPAARNVLSKHLAATAALIPSIIAGSPRERPSPAPVRLVHRFLNR